MEEKKITNLSLILLLLYVTRVFSEECSPTRVLKNTAVDIADDSEAVALSMYEGIDNAKCKRACCDTERCTMVMFDRKNKRCTLIYCKALSECTVDSTGSIVIYFGDNNISTTDIVSPIDTATPDRTLTTINTTPLTAINNDIQTNSSDYSTNSSDLQTDGKVNLTNIDDNSTNSGDESTKLNSRDNTTNTIIAGSELTSVQSTSASPTSSSTFISTPVSFSTLSLGLSTTTNATAGTTSSTNSNSMKETTTFSSFSPSSSVILTALTTVLSVDENVTVSSNKSLMTGLNETNENIAAIPEISANETVTGNNSHESTDQNASSTTNVKKPAHNTEITTSTTVISGSTNSVTPGSTFKQSSTWESRSNSTSISWWLSNLSSVPTTLSLPMTKVTTLSSTISLIPTVSSTKTSTVKSTLTSSTSSTTSLATNSPTISELSSKSPEISTRETLSSPSETTAYTSSSTSGNNQTGNESHSENKTYLKNPDQMSGALVAALCIGIVFTFAVAVLFGKRLFDAWQRRHYSKLDYLINGMYS